jgi:hypothetical protein
VAVLPVPVLRRREEVQRNGHSVRIDADGLMHVVWLEEVARARWVVMLPEELRIADFAGGESPVALDALYGDGSSPPAMVVSRC